MVMRRHNPFVAQRKRLPYKALLRRAGAFRKADADVFKATIARVAAGSDHLTYAGSRGDEADCTVICFDTEEKARAMQAWIDASGFEERPRPESPPGLPQLKVG
jgi:hypothetical protein